MISTSPWGASKESIERRGQSIELIHSVQGLPQPMGNHYVFFGNSGQLEGGQDEVERGPLEPGEEHGGGGALV